MEDNVLQDTKFDTLYVETHNDGYVMPYTDEELVRRAEKGRREIAEGKYYTNDEVIRMLHRTYEKVAV